MLLINIIVMENSILIAKYIWILLGNQYYKRTT